MKSHFPRPQPPAKSKTALRRGHLTPGHPAARKDSPPRLQMPTTYAEQALLFAEAASCEPVLTDRPVD